MYEFDSHQTKTYEASYHLIVLQELINHIKNTQHAYNLYAYLYVSSIKLLIKVRDMEQVIAKQRIKELIPKFGSLRKAAKEMGVSPSTLSDVLSEKRPISNRLSSKLKELKSSRIDQNQSHKVHLNNDSYFVVADKMYYRLLCLLTLEEISHEHENLALLLGVPVNKLHHMIYRLSRLGYLKETVGGYKVQDVELVTSENERKDSLKFRHLDNLEDAKDALVKRDVSERDFSFMTLAMPKNELENVQRMIRNFQDDLYSYIKSRSINADEVYEFCFQVFPVLNKRD